MKNLEIRIGIAPIGWTNDDMPELGAQNSFEKTIDEMAMAGYAGTEIGNKYPTDPKVLYDALDKRGLRVCNAWLSTYLTTRPSRETFDEYRKKIKFLHEVGARVIGVSEQGHSIQGKMEVPVLPNKPNFSEREWNKLSNGLNYLGELASEKDMTLTYHHHMGTGVQTTGEIDTLMERTDPASVSLLYDTGHLVFSGEDPQKVLDSHVDRVRHVHLKDVRKKVLQKVKKDNLSFLQAVREGVFTVPGDGMINFEPLFKTLLDSNYSGWMVVEAEQDPAKANPLEYATKARTYVRDKVGR